MYVMLPCRYQLLSTISIVKLVPGQFLHIKCFVEKEEDMFNSVYVTSHITPVIIPALSFILKIIKSDIFISSTPIGESQSK